MRKLILAIIAIFCGQAAFIVYMNRQPDTELVSTPETPPAVEAMVRGRPVVPSYLSESPETAQASVAEPESRPTRSKPLSTDVSERRNKRPARTPQASGPLVVRRSEGRAENGFENVVISYARSSGEPDCEPEAAKRQNNSLFAKAAPIVRKPWGFLRSIGSKLN